MPIYTYKHPNKEEFIEVIQGMNDVHEYIDETGLRWERIYEAPGLSIDSRIDPYSVKDFLRATASKKGTIGDLFDYSKEMSERRGGAENDPILRKKYNDFKKQTGREHPDIKKKKSQENLKKMGVSVYV